MRALDLFCGAGGAAMGLHRAGFEVVGVDIKPQPRYPFTFVRADALTYPLEGFDLIWASPCCQRWTAGAQGAGTDQMHPDFIEPMRARLRAAGFPYVIENVPRAPLIDPVVLTGCMFGLNTYRRRHFEASFTIPQLKIGKPFGPRTRKDTVTVAGSSGGKSNRDQWTNGAKSAWQKAIGIDWMLNREMAESVPPAYAQFIAECFLHFGG